MLHASYIYTIRELNLTFFVDYIHVRLNMLYLYLSVALASKHMPAILNCVLNEFAS